MSTLIPYKDAPRILIIVSGGANYFYNAIGERWLRLFAIWAATWTSACSRLTNPLSTTSLFMSTYMRSSSCTPWVIPAPQE